MIMCISLPHCKLVSAKNDIPKEFRQLYPLTKIDSIDEEYRESMLTARDLKSQQRSIRNQFSFPTITNTTVHSIYDDEEGNLEDMIQNALSNLFTVR